MAVAVSIKASLDDDEELCPVLGPLGSIAHRSAVLSFSLFLFLSLFLSLVYFLCRVLLRSVSRALSLPIFLSRTGWRERRCTAFHQQCTREAGSVLGIVDEALSLLCLRRLKSSLRRKVNSAIFRLGRLFMKNRKERTSLLDSLS